jgi:hypothetical protein
MNEWDRDNLEYFLSLSKKDFDALMDEFSFDDFMYTIKLIRTAMSELMIQEMEENDVEDTSDAKAVLKKFTLKG